MGLVTNDVAVADMRRLGNAEPLEPYPGGARKPWKCRCLNERCGRTIYPNRNNVMNGQGACKYCAPNAPVGPAAATAAMLGHGFITLVRFPGTGKPWLSKCVAAGHLVAPRYDNTTRRGGRCRFCTHRGPGDPKQAVVDMKAAGFTPLEPYRNVSTPWTSLCNGCGTIVSPNLNNVRTRGRCCPRCAKYGLNPAAPAWLYVMAHVVFGAVKVGITGRETREDRIARLQGSGWAVVRTWPFDTGAVAYRIEQNVLKQLRAQGNGPYLTAERMPAGGWTETFDATVVATDTLCRLVSDALTEPPV
ncbi:hypothetical protein [Streptomyces sp. NPDC059460]|uniref:hypothetical protein n=1 Tax=Streptomyces sp. NPDC059460 TaxID=3346840 RepID=UPI003689DCF5